MTEKRILVVDYDAGSLEKLSKLLKSNKYHVVKAADGEAGYGKFRGERPDLVVAEAMLPKMHGFDLARRVNQESQGRVPVVIVSGLYKGPQYRQEALGPVGAAAFFEKPWEAETLLGAIKRLLEDDDGIDDALPDANAVLEALDARSKKRAAGRGEGKPPQKGKRP